MVGEYIAIGAIGVEYGSVGGAVVIEDKGVLVECLLGELLCLGVEGGDDGISAFGEFLVVELEMIKLGVVEEVVPHEKDEVG